MTPPPIKRFALAIGAAVAGPSLARRVLQRRGLVFMLHRFTNLELGIVGHEPAALRRSLAYLRGRGYQIMSLESLFRQLAADSSSVRGSIAFTIDDGYADQALIGAPVFAEFDCPVTTFVTTGFLDGVAWFWWDQIAYVFQKTRGRRIQVNIGDQLLRYEWDAPAGRDRCCKDFTAHCKDVPEEVKALAVHSLASEAGVSLPARAPVEYAPMTWDDVRKCERDGMSFGPHTVTHPILSRAGDAQSSWEIVESWERLRAEATSPVPVFCYPNGQPGDYSEREMDSLARAGMLAAVVGTPGYADAAAFTDGDRSRYVVPRYQWPEDVPGLARFASGLERVKQLLTRRT